MTRSAKLGCGVLLALWCAVALGAGHGSRSGKTVSRDYSDARDLFTRVLEPGEPGPAGGDGLGPLYNETSCAGCHHLGGIGGGGRNEHNVVILTAFAGPPREERGDRVFQGELEDLHPGFRNSKSVVLHRHALSNADEQRLDKMRAFRTVQTRAELIALRTSARNTPALFGAGLIDAIHEKDLLAAEERKFPGFPEIKGRVSRLRDRRLGRFGWKGQTASLRDFVLAACSNELGLEVPGHHQVSLESAQAFDPSKMNLDLDERDCRLLVEFVRTIPRPVIRAPGGGLLPVPGLATFEAIGCATCHARRLGDVNNFYSDLLLHDLGDRFLDFGGGYGGSGSSTRVVDSTGSKAESPSSGEAGPTEWRTAPLWGVADSAPYLHDGRAQTLDQAIRLHGGEAAKTSERYANLAHADRQALLAFLHALTAPPSRTGKR